MAKANESGVLFCAAVGPRTYLRYVRTDASWQPLEAPVDPETGRLMIESELGTCLRLAECEPETPRVVPRSLEEDVIFDLWEVAQQDIWRAWMLGTDPANLQPKVRPLNRRVADFIRANQPPEIDASALMRPSMLSNRHGRAERRPCSASGSKIRPAPAAPSPLP